MARAAALAVVSRETDELVCVDGNHVPGCGHFVDAKPPAFLVREIPLDLIDIGDNIRTDPGDLEELAASIREHGVIQPVKAAGPVLGRYVLVWGQRRVLAARLAGLTTIPTIVIVVEEISAAERSIEQLVENLLRADLNPIEEAIALREVLAADPALTHEWLADKLGRSRPWVSNSLRLLGVDDRVQALVRSNEISASHARAIAGLPMSKQAHLADRAARERLTTRDIEQTVHWHESEVEVAEAKRKRTERVTPKVIAALEKAGVAKTASLYVTGPSYELDVEKISAAIKKAGWKKLSQRYLYGERKDGCDCTAVRVEISGRGAGVIPACDNDDHRRAREGAKREENERSRAEQREQLAAFAAAVSRELAVLPRVVLEVIYVKFRSGSGYWSSSSDASERDVDALLKGIGENLSQAYSTREIDIAAITAALTEPVEGTA